MVNSLILLLPLTKFNIENGDKEILGGVWGDFESTSELFCFLFFHAAGWGETLCFSVIFELNQEESRRTRI